MKRICASSWTIAKNHCMMHGQQNVKNVTLTTYQRTFNCLYTIVIVCTYNYVNVIFIAVCITTTYNKINTTNLIVLTTQFHLLLTIYSPIFLWPETWDFHYNATWIFYTIWRFVLFYQYCCEGSPTIFASSVWNM